MFRALGPRGVSIPLRMLPMASQTNDAGDAVGVGGPAITRGIASPGKQAVPLSPLDLPLSVSPPPYADLASTDPYSRAYRETLAPLSWIRHEADVQFNIISSAPREAEEAKVEEDTLEAGGKGKERDGVDELGYNSGSVVAPALLPDILDDTLDDKDFEYAIQLQIEELQRVAHEFEDEKMARQLAGESVAVQEDQASPRYNLRSRAGIESVAMPEEPSPRYNLRPRPSRAGTVSNATAGPSSRSSATTTRNSIKKKT